MIVTHRSITRREKSRRRFRHWYKKTTVQARVEHFMNCPGCVGCTSVLNEIMTYAEERDDIVR